MKTERRLLLSALFLVFAFPAIGSAWDSYGIDEGKLNVSGDGYIIGISNDGEDMMLLRILDTGNVSTFEVQHRIYLDAVNLAEEMELEDFSAVYGDDEALFQERLDRKLNDLMLLEMIGMKNGEYAPNLVRFFTEDI